MANLRACVRFESDIHMTRRALFAGLLLIALITACSPAASTPTASTISTPVVTPDTATESAESSPVEDALRAGEARPAWATMELVNAATGVTFTLSDFPDKTIYVEPMATWCTNCRRQQGDVRTVREQLGEANYVYISLSVEPNDTTPGLAQYAVRENFPWIFAIAPPDMIRELVAQFGRTITNPPSTPHFIISPSGSVSQLSTGHHSVDQLVAQLTTAAGA